tara:strand:+ start:247 stop:657 length:411 start_codon:yes stop_codon:yes gene_type:complete
MKNFISAIVFSIVTLTFFNCRSIYIAKNSDKWKKFELRPSQVSLYGDVFFTSKLDDNTSFEVFYDDVVYEDGKFYYKVLMDDFGWYKNITGNWSGDAYTVRDTKFGYIYVNPKRKVAIYFNPSSDKYTAFKVKLII